MRPIVEVQLARSTRESWFVIGISAPFANTILRLGVGEAAAEGGDGFGFVGEGGDGVDEAGEFENVADVSAGVEEFQAAALAFEADERADQSADAGAIHLGDAGEIDDDFGGTLFTEAAKFSAETIVADADDDAANEVENGDSTGFALGNLQAHRELLRRITRVSNAASFPAAGLRTSRIITRST